MKYSIIFILLFTFSSFGQTEKASLDSWRGLTLDQSTSEQILEKFSGQKTDKSNQPFRPLKYDEWFDKKNKNFRVIHYENIEGFKDVKLFLLNNKLVVIQLEPKQLAASALQKAYEVEFEPLISGFDQAASPRDYERNKGKVYPKSFPTVYNLLGQTEQAIAFAGVGNSSFGAILSKSMGVGIDDSNSLPGKIFMLQLISRTLENNKGIDLLK